MSRLDSAIRRLRGQRACLDLAIGLVEGLEGPVLEVGLGNGRSYDHLREHMPGRDIFVFDRRVAAHPDCIPPDDRMILGDLPGTLDGVALPGPAVLAHVDVGTGDKAATLALAASVAGPLALLMSPGGVMVTDQPMRPEGWRPGELPEGVAPGRYHVYLGPART